MIEITGMDPTSPLLNEVRMQISKPVLTMVFSLLSIIIIIIMTSTNKTCKIKSNKMDQNPRPFESIEVNICFLRCPLRLLTAAKSKLLIEQSLYVIDRRIEPSINVYAIELLTMKMTTDSLSIL